MPFRRQLYVSNRWRDPIRSLHPLNREFDWCTPTVAATNISLSCPSVPCCCDVPRVSGSLLIQWIGSSQKKSSDDKPDWRV